MEDNLLALLSCHNTRSLSLPPSLSLTLSLSLSLSLTNTHTHTVKPDVRCDSRRAGADLAVAVLALRCMRRVHLQVAPTKLQPEVVLR